MFMQNNHFNKFMKIKLQILALSIILSSCNENTKKPNEKPIKKEATIEQAVIEEKNIDEINLERIKNSGESIKIQFSDLTISMRDYHTNWADENLNDNIYETKNDTANFYLGPGYLLERSFKIDPPEFDEIELYGQFEVKMGIYTKRELEQPFCLLDDWKTYTSEWTQLNVDKKDLQFSMINDQTKSPIEFTIDEFKTAVEKHCGPEWSDDIRNIESFDKMNAEFFTTKYIYKIKAKNSKTNKIVERFVVFYTPTSC